MTSIKITNREISKFLPNNGSGYYIAHNSSAINKYIHTNSKGKSTFSSGGSGLHTSSIHWGTRTIPISEEEKDWYIACQEAGKFIPLDDIKPKELNYDIY